MAKYTAHLQAVATATITVDVPDDVVSEGAEAIIERIYNQAQDWPSLCAHCSGWGKGFSLELGDFEAAVHDTGEHEGLAYVTDEDGEPVTD